MQKDRKEGVTRGTSHALACPWCGEINKGLESLGNDLKVNSVLECDLCNNLYEITSMFEVTHIVAERNGEMLHDGHIKKQQGLVRRG